MTPSKGRQAKAWLQTLPALPKAAEKILRALQDEHASWRSTAAALEEDAVITLRVLSLANSPFYGAAGRVHSAGDAIQILGLSTLTGIVLASALRPPTLCTETSPVDVESFWRQGLHTAQLARFMASAADLDGDLSYLAAVLYKTGQLLHLTLPANAGLDEQDQNAPTLAALAGEHWGLPPPVVQVLRDLAGVLDDAELGGEPSPARVICWAASLLDLPPQEVAETHPTVLAIAQALSLSPATLVQQLKAGDG
ncbi:MAG: hypothetical protein C4K60_01105 [Ideonella sp. MAG2]|nr:MAG: hypothetical protein C4K60_01105 [Ideonella sp. MAG2]